MTRRSRPLEFLLARGLGGQNFLGASWPRWFLNSIPGHWRRRWALRLLRLSPHYFFDDDHPRFAGMSRDEFLEAEFEINLESRRDIHRQILARFLEKDFVVVDYGCGPGFLSRAVAPHVLQVYAVDISDGALACGRVLNSAENILYTEATERGLSTIPAGAADLIFSFAVIQHLTEETFKAVLGNCFRLLRKGGRLVFHIQLEDEVWRPESEVRSRRKLRDRLRFRYGLHCFGGSVEWHRDLVIGAGFRNVQIEGLVPAGGPESLALESQKLLVATR